MIRFLAVLVLALVASTAQAQYPNPYNPYYHPNAYYYQRLAQQRQLAVQQWNYRQAIAQQRAYQNWLAQQRFYGYQNFLAQRRLMMLGHP
jgi:hypothetical protein